MFFNHDIMRSSTTFLGEIASTMDKLTTRALQAQVEAAVRHLVYAYSGVY